MQTDALDYNLPPELIAAQPANPRDAARLMIIQRATETITHTHVRDLAESDLLQSGDLLVVNQTRVLPAYFHATRASTGGKVTGLYLAGHDAIANQPAQWQVMLESRGKLKPGERLTLEGGAALILDHPTAPGQWLATLHSNEPGLLLLERIGQTPLPPYIRKARRLASQPEIRREDADRYNTVYAQSAGSLAAPTAGLHFTDELLARLAARGIRRTELTLHVGLGTFAPIRSESLEQHPMHAESIHIPAATIDAIKQTRAAGRRIIAVGTTSVRAMESLPDPLENHHGDYAAETRLFIHPEAGFTFRFTDALLTNFHLPRSTLLAMVASLPNVTLDQLKNWYAQAIAERYHFYSYGDAMLLI